MFNFKKGDTCTYATLDSGRKFFIFLEKRNKISFLDVYQDIDTDWSRDQTLYISTVVLVLLSFSYLWYALSLLFIINIYIHALYMTI